MTANEFRNQKISNTRLAWLVFGHRVESFDGFTKEELLDIYRVEDEEEKRLEIVIQILAKGMTEDEVKSYLA